MEVPVPSEGAQQSARIAPVETALSRYAAAATRFAHEVGARAGLTISTCEANFVHLLQLHGPLSPGRLGAMAGLGSSGTITGVIDRLEKAGYVQRTRCVEDRRKVSVSLNEEWLAAENAERTKRLAELVAEYDDDQLATITGFLNRLADVEVGPPAPEPG